MTGNESLMGHVAGPIEQRWPPEQIAGRLDVQPPKRLAGVTISHAKAGRCASNRTRFTRFTPKSMSFPACLGYNFAVGDGQRYR